MLASHKAIKKGQPHRTQVLMFPQMIYAISFSTKPLTQQIERNAFSSLTRPHDLHSGNLSETVRSV
jgi:hypothetical protein